MHKNYFYKNIPNHYHISKNQFNLDQALKLHN